MVSTKHYHLLAVLKVARLEAAEVDTACAFSPNLRRNLSCAVGCFDVVPADLCEFDGMKKLRFGSYPPLISFAKDDLRDAENPGVFMARRKSGRRALYYSPAQSSPEWFPQIFLAPFSPISFNLVDTCLKAT